MGTLNDLTKSLYTGTPPQMKFAGIKALIQEEGKPPMMRFDTLKIHLARGLVEFEFEGEVVASMPCPGLSDVSQATVVVIHGMRSMMECEYK